MKRCMPLTMANIGQKVVLVAVNGGKNTKERLAGMGLTPGVELNVLYAGPGPLRIGINNTRLALGHGMANKISVEMDLPD